MINRNPSSLYLLQRSVAIASALRYFISIDHDLTRKLYDYFETDIEIARIRHGKRQTVETLINEEAFLLAQYLRGENKEWCPRIAF